MGVYIWVKEKIGDLISYKKAIAIAFGVFVYSYFNRNITLDYLLIIIISILISWNSITFIKRIKYVLSNNDYYSNRSTYEGWENSRCYNPLLISSVYGLYITDVNHIYYFGLFFVTITVVIQFVYYFILEKDWVWPWLICGFIILSNLWSSRFGTNYRGFFERQQYVVPVELKVLKDNDLKSLYKEHFKLNDSISKHFTGVQLQKIDLSEIDTFVSKQVLIDSYGLVKIKKDSSNEFKNVFDRLIGLRFKELDLVEKKGIQANCNILIKNKNSQLSQYLVDPFLIGFIRYQSKSIKKQMQIEFLTLKLHNENEIYELDTIFNKFNYIKDSEDAFFRLKTRGANQFVGVYSSLKREK